MCPQSTIYGGICFPSNRGGAKHFSPFKFAAWNKDSVKEIIYD